MEFPRLISLLGLFTMLAIAWVCSENRRAIPWRLVGFAVALQFIFALLILRTQLGQTFFSAVRGAFDLITAASNEGAAFVFGNLGKFFILPQVLVPGADGLETVEYFPISAVIAFQVLPVIIFVSGIAAVLQHLRIIQYTIHGIAWVMRRTLKTSGAETFGAALLIFIGIESVAALGDYLKSMTRSELFTIMAAFLATIAASVMVAYAGFGAEPGHLMAASLMSAPAAIAIAKIMVPETGTPQTAGEARIEIPIESHNIFDAAALGAMRGMHMALNVAALLIVFVGMIYLVNQASIGVTGAPVTALLGWCFRPFAFLMGVPWQDTAQVGELLAVKSVFNEFLAYQQLQPLIQEGALHPRSITIATYALCGFANPGSLGIIIGALAGMAPDRRQEVAQLSMRAYVAGTLAAFTTACIAGVLTPG